MKRFLLKMTSILAALSIFVALVPQPVSAASTGTSDFVTRFYQQCLNRNPDAAGLQYWVSSLESGVQTGASVAQGFVFSSEFTSRNVSNDEYIKIMYKAFFNRQADSAGYNTWSQALTNGRSRFYVLAGFTNSQEFINLCASYGIQPGSLTLTEPADKYPDIAAFVTRFYQQCLGRGADATGLNNWINNLQSGTKTGCDVAYGFIFSAEFINRNVTNETFVNILYKAFFNRDADAAGYTYWANYLKAGYSRQYVLSGFVNSQEFKNLCSKYGINPGSMAVPPTPTPTPTPKPTPTPTKVPTPTPSPIPTIPKANIANGVYNIVSKSTGMYMNAYSDAATAAPWKVVTAASDGTNEQQFRIEKQADGTYKIYCQNYGGTKLLTIEYDYNVGRQLNITETNYPAAQRYYIYDRGNGNYSISPADANNPSRVIGFSSSGPYSNSRYLQMSSYSGATEQWNLVQVPVSGGVILPVDKNAGAWFGLTYEGEYPHYMYGKYQYSAIDFNLSGGADTGKNVYAVQDGIVSSNSAGCLIIKHTTPLVLRNGYTYSTWYSLYGHMTNSTLQANTYVSKGTVLGQISNVGLPSSYDPHLHFVLYAYYSVEDVAASISPYWLPGDYYNAKLYADDPYETREPAGLYEKLIFRAMPQ